MTSMMRPLSVSHSATLPRDREKGKILVCWLSSVWLMRDLRSIIVSSSYEWDEIEGGINDGLQKEKQRKKKLNAHRPWFALAFRDGCVIFKPPLQYSRAVSFLSVLHENRKQVMIHDSNRMEHVYTPIPSLSVLIDYTHCRPRYSTGNKHPSTNGSRYHWPLHIAQSATLLTQTWTFLRENMKRQG